MNDLFTAGETARDAALEDVAANAKAWMADALVLIQSMEHRGFTVTGEDVSVFVAAELGPPHHPNANGALIMNAVRKKILKATGEYRPMKKRQSHARKTPVYRISGEK